MRQAASEPIGPLTLGTVQIGMAYGIVNRVGVPDDAELRAILDVAMGACIHWIDTARVYGNAEERLGALHVPRVARIVTKIAPLDALMRETGIDDAVAATSLSLERSLTALATPRVDVVMLHIAEDASRDGVLDVLTDACGSGRIGAVGVSVYTPEEAVRWLADDRVTHIQLPCNAIDHRWRSEAFAQARAARRDVIVHARSAFLQGLLLAPASAWPSWVERAPEIVDALGRAAAGLPGGRAELCLRHHRSLGWIDTSVVGVATAGQLREIVDAASDRPLDSPVLAMLDAVAPLVPPRLLDPRLW